MDVRTSPIRSISAAVRLFCVVVGLCVGAQGAFAQRATLPPVEQEDAGVGGGSVSAALADSRAKSLQLLKDLVPQGTVPGTMPYYIALYTNSGGGPYLHRIGIDLFDVIDGTAFRALQYMAYTLCMIFAVFGVLQSARSGKVGLDAFATIIIKCLAGGVLASKTAMAMLYAVLMMIQSAATSVISLERDQVNDAQDPLSRTIDQVRDLISGNGLNVVALRAAKREGVNDAYLATAGALTNAESVDDLRKIARRYNEFIDWFNGTGKAAVPMAKIDDDTLNVDESSAEPLRTAIREVLGRILDDPPYVATGDSPFAIGTRLEQIDVQHVPGINQLASTPANQARLNSRIGAYRDAIRDATQLWVRDVLVQPAVDPDAAPGTFGLAWRLLMSKASAGWAAASNTASALNPFTAFREWLMSWFRKGVAWTFGTALELIFGLALEICLLLVIITYPFWLWEKTAAAFKGAVNNAFVSTLYLPVFQFGVLILDLIMASLRSS